MKDKTGRIFGLFLFAVSIPLIYNSAEFKPYSGDALICILLLIYYNYVYSKNTVIINGKIKQAVFYALMTVLTVFFSFPAVFVIFSMALTNCIFERKITLEQVFIVLGIIIAGSSVYFPDINGYNFLRDFWWWGGNKSFVFMCMTSIKYFTANTGDKFCYFFILLLSAGFIILFRDKKQPAFVLLICVSVSVSASLLKLYPFEERLILYLLPVFLLLIAKLFDYNIFLPARGKHQAVFKLILCIVLALLINIKIPYWNFPQENLVDYSRYDDFKRSMAYRREMKAVSLFVLKNYNKNISILSTDEFYYFVRYYNKYFNMGKNIPVNNLGWGEDGGSADEIAAGFIDENSGKNTMWFIGRYDENYFRIWELKNLENMLNERNIPFDIMHSRGNAYLVYTL